MEFRRQNILGGWFGWGASLLVHLLLGVGLFWVSRGEEKAPDKVVMQGYLVEAVERLEVEPVVENLQVEAAIGLDAMETIEPVALEEMVPAGMMDDGIGVVGGKEGSGVTVGIHKHTKQSESFEPSFCGLQGSGRRVCFVVDCSGSMVVAIDYVRGELKRSLRGLSPGHYFQVVFYAGDVPVSLERGKLLRATRQNVLRAIQFVDEAKLGQVGNVVAAMGEAFSAVSAEGERADLVYLLTDGEFDARAVAQSCKKFRQKNVSLHVVGCGNRENKPLLKKLARDNRGRFRFVGVDELDAAILKGRTK